MLKRSAAIICVGLVLTLTACLSFSPRNTVTQVSTIDALLAGSYDGSLTCAGLLKHGNLGIGTFDRLDGEMVIAEGRVYQVRSDGRVYEPDRALTTPFAAVCSFPTDRTVAFNRGADYDTVREALDQLVPSTNLFCAVKIRGLAPVSGTEWMSAGVSSPVTDGSSAVILMSGEKVKALKLTPLARIAYNTVIGSNPRLMLTGPVDVWPKMKAISGLDHKDIGLFEVNEAFAPIPLAFTKAYGIPLKKLNVNGGALALGHPIGNSGVRLSCTIINEMRRRKERYGYVTLCTGGGMAPAIIFELA